MSVPNAIWTPESLRSELVACGKTVLALHKKANSGHIGSSLSCLQILVDLAFRRMQTNDRLILSKGHAASALYTVLARSGRIPLSALDTFYVDGTKLAAHPPCSGPFESIPFGTGSLGHGLSLAAGFVFSQRYTKKTDRIFCVLSDGDCNEGSTWEAALFAGHHRLENLTVIVDANGIQGLGSTQSIMSLEPLEQKWKSFGFETVVVEDGNSLADLDRAFGKLKAAAAPLCLIARTSTLR